MAALIDAHLSIEADPGRSHRRQVTVRFRVKFTPAEVAVGQVFAERVTLQSVPNADPSAHGQVHPLNLVLADRALVAQAGGAEREVTLSVPRHVLDVDQDWWRSDESGQPEPIAEFEDRLVAQIDLVAYVPPPPLHAQTNIVTGSWGVLGDD